MRSHFVLMRSLPRSRYLLSWRKHASNPVIAESRALEGVFNVFDPHCWLDEDGETYNMILGGRVKPYDIGDTAYLFRSTNLIDWEYLLRGTYAQPKGLGSVCDIHMSLG